MNRLRDVAKQLPHGVGRVAGRRLAVLRVLVARRALICRRRRVRVFASGTIGVTNNGTAPVTLYPYGLIARQGTPKTAGFFILHEGLIGVLDGRAWQAGLPGGPLPLQVRQYARLEGLVDHPPGVVLKTVQARITDAAGAVRVSETLNIP